MENTLRPPYVIMTVTPCHHSPQPSQFPPHSPQFHVITVILVLAFLLILRQFMMFWRVGKFKQILLKLHLLKNVYSIHIITVDIQYHYWTYLQYIISHIARVILALLNLCGLKFSIIRVETSLNDLKRVGLRSSWWPGNLLCEECEGFYLD